MRKLIVIGLLVLNTWCVCTKQGPQHGYMTHYYFSRKPVFINDSMVLELTNRLLPSVPDKDYLACDIKIVTSPGRKLLVHFLSLTISDESNIDRLQIYDYQPNSKPVRITPAQGLYGLYDEYYHGLSMRVADYMSSGNTLKLDYQGRPTLAFDGFKILITSFRDAKGDCGRGYVRCNLKQICIPTTTWCDDFTNCGRGDSSDEDGCSHSLHNTWQPIDGQVTAVVAASAACAVLFISAVVVVLVVMKINKREVLNATANISVEFRKRKCKKKAGQNHEHLTRLYAPPSYEVVIGMDEDPPPYQSIAEEYNTESDDDSVLERVIENSASHACANVPTGDNVLNGNYPSTSKGNNCDTASTQVVCDIEQSHTDEETLNSPDFQNLTNYRVCSSACENSPNNNKKRKVIVRGASSLGDIEVITAEDTCSSEHNQNTDKGVENTKLKPANGHAGKPNGLNGKCNGHTAVKYTRTPSKREAASIEYIDSD